MVEWGKCDWCLRTCCFCCMYTVLLELALNNIITLLQINILIHGRKDVIILFHTLDAMAITIVVAVDFIMVWI